MGELDGVYGKLDRARLHARDLKERIETALHPDLYAFDRKVEDNPSEYVYYIDRLPYIDPEWSLVFGDFLTNLRAALDHLAWQLALREVRNPSESTQFPIYESPRCDANGNPKPARICNVEDPSVIAALEAVQPYSGADARPGGAQNSGLYILNNLVNIDKHRLLLVITAALDLSGSYWAHEEGAVVPTLTINPRPLNDGDEVARFDFHGAELDPGFEPHLGLEIRVNDGPAIAAIRNPDILNLVGRLYWVVEHGVLGLHFAQIFGASPRHWASAFAIRPTGV